MLFDPTVAGDNLQYRESHLLLTELATCIRPMVIFAGTQPELVLGYHCLAVVEPPKESGPRAPIVVLIDLG